MFGFPLKTGLALLVAAFSLVEGRGEADKIRVACIGDSITWGSAMTNRIAECYPAQLQRLLGERYDVRNFGDPGAGVYSNPAMGPSGWRAHPWSEGRLARDAYAFMPDIVVSNLGINDNETFLLEYTYDGDGKPLAEPGLFRREYGDLLRAFANNGKMPRIIMWTRLGPLGKSHRGRGRPNPFVMEHALRDVAADVRAETLDMYTPLVPYAETEHFADDGVHPEGGAQKVIAEITAARIQNRDCIDCDKAVCNAMHCHGRDGGRFYDFVWENDKFGMRAYGEGDCHVWSGFDVFNKSVSRNVCIEWMCGIANGKSGASPNYHVNSGEGMDNYTMGASRGVGGVAMFADGEWKTYPNFESCRVIHTGADYCEFELVYPPFSEAGKMTYHITLRCGERFFRNDVSFERMPVKFLVGPGMDLEAKRDHKGDVWEGAGVVSIFEDPKGEGGRDGSTMSAVFVTDPSLVVPMTDNQNSRVLAFQGQKSFTYWAGASWSQAGEITTPRAWHSHVRDFVDKVRGE